MFEAARGYRGGWGLAEQGGAAGGRSGRRGVGAERLQARWCMLLALMRCIVR